MSVRGNHDRPHIGVGEVEDGVDELAIILLDEVFRGGFVDHAQQLLLVLERDAAPRSGSDAVAEHDESVRERAEKDPRAPYEGRRRA